MIDKGSRRGLPLLAAATGLGAAALAAGVWVATATGEPVVADPASVTARS